MAKNNTLFRSKRQAIMSDAATNKVYHYSLQMLACGTDGCAVKISLPHSCEKDGEPELSERLRHTAVLKIPAAPDSRLPNSNKIIKILNEIDPKHEFTLEYAQCTQPSKILKEAAKMGDTWFDNEKKKKLKGQSLMVNSRDVRLAVMAASPPPSLLMEYGGNEISTSGFNKIKASGSKCTIRAFIIAFRSMFTIVRRLFEHGYMHGDIKPINMTLMPPTDDLPPRIKLIDFDRLKKIKVLAMRVPSNNIYEYSAPEKMRIGTPPNFEEHFINYAVFKDRTLYPYLGNIISNKDIAEALDSEFENALDMESEKKRLGPLVGIYDESPVEYGYTNGIDMYGLGTSFIKGVLIAVRFANLNLRRKLDGPLLLSVVDLIRATLVFGAKLMQPNPLQRVACSDAENAFDDFYKNVVEIPGINEALDLDIF